MLISRTNNIVNIVIYAIVLGCEENSAGSTLAHAGPWVTEGFWENTAVTEFESSSIGDAQQQLEGETKII